MSANSRIEFFRRLDGSRRSTFLVAEYLHRAGYDVHIPAFDFPAPEENWEDHVDDGDIYIWKDAKDKMRIDVKHISVNFTERGTFRFSHMFVADIRAVKRANPFPTAYIVVNKDCSHMGIIWGKTKQHWEPHDVFASNTNKMITVMRCPVAYVDFRSFQ